MRNLKPITKFNSGIGAVLCNKCRVIVKENLTREYLDRPYILFCDKHWAEYCSETVEPAWVCLDCASERGASPSPGHIHTIHTDVCGICGQEKEVTEPRDFGLTRGLLRVKK